MKTSTGNVKKALGNAMHAALSSTKFSVSNPMYTSRAQMTALAAPLVKYLYSSGSTLSDVCLNGSTTTTDITAANLYSNNNIYINYNGPNGDSYLYFYTGGNPAGASLSYKNSGYFEFSTALNVTGNLFGSDIRATGNVYVNYNGPNGDSYLYFYENSSDTGVYLKWDDSPGEFFLNKGLMVTNHLVVKSDNYVETVLGYFVERSSSDATSWHKIATLPVSATNTYDHLRLSVNVAQADSSNVYSYDVILGNRGGFYGRVLNAVGHAATQTVAGIRVYEQGDGSQEVYIYALTGYWSGIRVDALAWQAAGGAGPTMVHPDHIEEITSAPAGSIVFDSTTANPTNDVTTKLGQISVAGNIYINNAGPDGDSYLYFYDGGSTTGQSIKWHDATGVFYASSHLYVQGTFYADTSVQSYGNIYINANGPAGDSYLYFYKGSSAAGASFKWDDTNSRFELSDKLKINGYVWAADSSIYSDEDVYVNQNGPNGNSHIYFYKDTATDAYLQFNDAADKFVINRALSVDSLTSYNDVYINYDGPNEDSYLYFYTGGMPTGASLSYKNSGYFEFSTALNVTGNLFGSDIKATGNIYINNDGLDGDSYLYFYENSSDTGASLKWDDGDSRFEFSDDLYITGSVNNSVLYSRSNIYVNYDGADGDSYLYFYENSSTTGAYLKWDDGDSRFEFNDDLYAGGGIEGATLYSRGNVYVNYDGTDGVSAVYFYNSSSATGEYLKWEDGDDRFELSNQLYMTSQKIVSLGTCTVAADAANKTYADGASDLKFKTNIIPLENCLADVNKLKPIRFNWNEKGKEFAKPNFASTEIGLLAQDIKEIYPEVVFDKNDGEQSLAIDYPKLTAVLIKAVQELTVKVNNLENKIK